MILCKQWKDRPIYQHTEHAGYLVFSIWCCSLPLMSWFFQVVRVTTCREQGNSCYGGQLEGRGGLRTVCRQQYMDHKLVALDQEKGEVVVETFSFPSCCSCFAGGHALAMTQVNARRPFFSSFSSGHAFSINIFSASGFYHHSIYGCKTFPQPIFPVNSLLWSFSTICTKFYTVTIVSCQELNRLNIKFKIRSHSKAKQGHKPQSYDAAGNLTYSLQ